MKILHVGEYVKGGVATYIQTLIDHQKKQHCVYLVLSDYNSEKKWTLPSEQIFFYSYKRKFSYFIQAILAIYKFISILQPDIIHVHSTWAGLYVRLLYFFIPQNTKIVYCAHGWSFLMEIPYWKRIVYAFVERILALKADRIVNISRYEHEQAIHYGIPADKCLMIYNGVKESSCAVLNHSISMNNKVKLLFIGRFDKQKGLDILLDIFQNFSFDKIELLIIGDKVINGQDVVISSTNIKQLGWIDHEKVDQYYSSCDAVIIPSRWEGFGLVAIEAMKNKRAVIASNRGALPEIVTHGYNGYIFDISQKNQLIEIIQNLDKGTLSEMGLRGYSVYRKRFTADLMNSKVMDLYSTLY